MTLDEHIQIEEILSEANAHGLRIEVQETASKFIKEGYGYVEAHSLAFNEWVK
jgi:hypothetical protein